MVEEQPMEDLDAQQRLLQLERRIEALESASSAGLPGARRPVVAVRRPVLAASPPDPGEYTLQGRIQPGLVADVLRLVSANIMTGVFTAQSGELKMELYLIGGEIVHAVGGGDQGRKAVLATLELESGRFGFLETTVQPDRCSLDEETRFLVLKAMRQTDEHHSATE
jgi:hypothetical protein